VKMLDLALKSVFRHKIRSGLTLLGIALGIGLIIGLGAIGKGLNKNMEEQFGSMGGIINVRADTSDEDAEGIDEDTIEEHDTALAHHHRHLRQVIATRQLVHGSVVFVGSRLPYTAIGPKKSLPYQA